MKALEDSAGGECVQREMRSTAREIFLHALEECSVERAFGRKLHYERGILQVGDDLYDLGTFSRIFVVSIGKAAHASVASLRHKLGDGVELNGIVAAPAGQTSGQVYGFRYFEGGHPLPNHESLLAAEAILRALDSLSSHSLVMYLLSGGGSAMVEKPFSDEIPFEDLVESYRVLVHSGAPIAQINAVRKHLSAVKGGRMAMAAEAAHQLSIMISDVPDEALDSLASGPTMPDTSTVEQCYEIVARYELLPRLPWSVRELLRRRGLEETPKPDDPAFERARWWPVLSNACAVKAAVEWAARNGFATQIDNSCDDWDYRKAGDYLLERVRELRRGCSRVCLISGGEVTVALNANQGDGKTSGRGGRNQQFALYCAQRIAGENICVLSAGTDGIDGNSPAAGAVADGTTMARASEKGLNAETALAGFNAYAFFEALGDTVVTGATGTNVRDVRVLLAW
jgi:hydroxypyruvate reductase